MVSLVILLLAFRQTADVICAVVVEKPFTRTSEEADELLILAKEKGLLLSPYQSTTVSLSKRCMPADRNQIAAGTVNFELSNI